MTRTALVVTGVLVAALAVALLLRQPGPRPGPHRVTSANPSGPADDPRIRPIGPEGRPMPDPVERAGAAPEPDLKQGGAVKVNGEKGMADRWWIPMSADEFAASVHRKAELDRWAAGSRVLKDAKSPEMFGVVQRPFGLSETDMIRSFDTDRDGVLSDIEQAEADAVLTAKMSEVDEDFREAADGASDWYAERVARFDANGDGDLDLDESYEAYLSDVETKASWRFHDRYDADRDGAVGADDLEAFLLLYREKDPRADVDDDGRLTERDVEAFEVAMSDFAHLVPEPDGKRSDGPED